MSFLVTPGGVAQIAQSFLGPGSLSFADNIPALASSMASIAQGQSTVGGVEKLIYDSVSPFLLFNLAYYINGTNLDNTRIRISDNDAVDLWNMAGVAAGVAMRGGFLLGGPFSGATANSIYATVLPIKRLKVYITTQFVDIQSQYLFVGEGVRLAS